MDSAGLFFYTHVTFSSSSFFHFVSSRSLYYYLLLQGPGLSALSADTFISSNY